MFKIPNENPPSHFNKSNYTLHVYIDGSFFISGNGCDDIGKFNPKEDITPQESAEILTKLFTFAFIGMTTTSVNLNPFVDYLKQNNLLKHFD